MDKKYLGTAITAAMTGLNIGIKALAVSAIALVIKMGIETYCEVFRPKSLMIARNEKD
ncbi:MAG: hypothetical protein KQH63_02165 [Desulfobulbaceae bacterium]|nr:hypothetical protein [Desulfobulbaceae bacterium]